MAAALLEARQGASHAETYSPPPATLLHYRETQQPPKHVESELACSLKGFTFVRAHMYRCRGPHTVLVATQQAGFSP